MRSRSFRLPLAVFALTVGLAARSFAVVQDRVAGAVTSANAVQLQGHVSPQLRQAVDQGPVSSAMPMAALSLEFQPSAAQQADMDGLLGAQHDSASPSFHKWLTPAQFGARFGMSDGDLAKVTGWLQAQGFSVNSVAVSRNAIHFSGTAGQVEQAFGAAIHSYTVNGETHFSNATEPMLPAAFAATVSSIRGLSDFKPKSHLKASTTLVPYAVNNRPASSVGPKFVSGGSEYLSPEDFAGIYDVKALYNAGFSGNASFPIAVVGQTQVNTADLTDFRAAFGLTTNVPTMVLLPGTGTSAINSSGDLQESELDLEWSGAVAPGVPIYFIYTGNNVTQFGVFDALQYAIQTYTVNGKPLPIISNSYGECEASDTAAHFATYESWFKQANTQGQTIIAASGDSGAADCDGVTTPANNYLATQGLAVDYPASSAYVTGLGGSSFSGDVASTATYWGTTNDTDYGNELGLYIPSAAWNDTPNAVAAGPPTNGLEASGGGASTLWPKPSWQTGVPGIPADGHRDIPDIALNADPNHDGYLICFNLGCEGSNASFNVLGGTSAASPSFAGILALTEQKLNAAQGNINPSLYTLASNAAAYASAFHDIATGTNMVPCVTGSPNCVGGLLGFSAGTGYDQVTGLGSLDANNLAASLATVATKVSSAATLTFTPAAPVTGQPVTFTATVTPVSGTTVPTGSVLFTIDAATTGTTVPLTAAGVATFTATFTAGGGHTVTGVYSGDTNFYGVTATATPTVTVAPNATNAATTTTLTASASTIAVGSSLTLTATVSSTVTGTLAGTVTFSTPAGTIGMPQQVLPSAAGNTGTATLTVSVALASLPVGADTITATFGGGGTDSSGGQYLASSGTTTVTVTNPIITLTATNISVASGGTGTSTITVTSGGGYAGTVNLAATTTSTTLSGNVVFAPTAVVLTAGGSGTSTLTISGVTSSAASGGTVPNSKSGGLSSLVVGGVTFAGLLLFGFAGVRRRRWATIFSVLAFSALVAGLGCSSSSTIPTPSKGPFTITVTGTDSATSTITGSTTFSLSIQ